MRVRVRVKVRVKVRSKCRVRVSVRLSHLLERHVLLGLRVEGGVLDETVDEDLVRGMGFGLGLGLDGHEIRAVSL